MSYAYGTKGAPAVGGGLPGLPRRQVGEAVASIPYGSLIYAPKAAPNQALSIGATYNRKDYPEVEKIFPIGSYPNMLNRDTTTAADGINSYTFDVNPNKDGSHVAVAFGNPVGAVRVYLRGSDGLLSSKLDLVCSSATGAATSTCFSPDGNFLFVKLNQATASLRVFARNGDSYAEVAVPSINIAAAGSGNVSVGYSPTGSGYTVLVIQDSFAGVYRFTGTAFQLVQSLITNGLAIPSATSTLVSPDGYFLVFRINGVNESRIYRWDGSSYVVQLLTLSINSVYFYKYVFSPESDALYCVATDPTYGGLIALDLSKDTGASNPRTLSSALLGTLLDAVPLPDGFVLAASSGTTADRWRLLKVSSGAITQIASTQGPTAPAGKTLRVSADGGHLFARAGTANTSVIIDYSDTTKFNALPIAGLHLITAE